MAQDKHVEQNKGENEKLMDDQDNTEETEEVKNIEVEKDQAELEVEDEEREESEEEKQIREKDEEIKRITEEKEEQYERMLRLQAEYENYKKRTQKERAAERKYQAQNLANELLPVLDNFERALQVEKNDETSSIIEGITMVYNQFLDALKSQGIEQIEAVGKQFDPNIHHAVMQVEDDSYDSNEIVEELQKGYMLKDRVLRPAMVKVNK